jgi:hypothetical protein
MSFQVKYGLNFNLSEFCPNPNGLLEPLRCKKNKCNPLMPAIKKGNKKCKVKNRVKEELSTAKPPQKIFTMIVPNLGITQIRLVITVAPQKLICPQGSTYPKKAVPMVKNRIEHPIIQT